MELVNNSNIAILNSNNQLFITSIEIADKVGYEHETVIRLIRENINDISELGLPDFKSESTTGRPRVYSLLNKDQATLLMTYFKNNAVVKRFKINLVKTFSEMEKQLLAIRNASQINPDEISRTQLAQMIIESEREKEILVKENEILSEQNDKLKTFSKKQRIINETLIATEENCTLTTAGKHLSVPPRAFIDKLIEVGYLYRSNNVILPYQQFINSEIFVVRSVQREIRGNMTTIRQTLVTPKGLTYFAKKLSQGKAVSKKKFLIETI